MFSGPAMPRSARSFRWFALLAVMALGAAACTDDGRPPLLSGLGESAAGLRTGLSCNQLLDTTRDQFEAELTFAERQVGAGALAEDELSVQPFTESAEPAAPGVTDSDGSATANAARAQAGDVVAGTNNQELGVDEADLVKTDGERIVSLVDGVLRVTLLDGSPAVDGSLDLRAYGADGGQMFLRGDEVLLLLPSWGYGDVGGFPEDDLALEEIGPDGGPVALPGEAPSAGETRSTAQEEPTTTTTIPETTSSTTAATSTTTTSSTTSTTSTTTTTTTTIPTPPEPSPLPFDQGVRILRVELDAHGTPRVVDDRAVEGSLVAARMIDGTARVVVRSAMPIVSELQSSGGMAEAQDAISELTVDDVLPRVSNAEGERTALGGCGDVAVLPVVDADAFTDVARRSALAEPSTVSVLTIGEDLGDLAPITVAGLADVVYASTDSLWVTSTGWTDDAPNTFVHRFTLTGDGPAAYTGSGIVPGTPLNQYSLSESEGNLRIVTTTEDNGTVPLPLEPDLPFAPGEPDPNAPVPDIVAPEEFVPATEGRLTVLRPSAGGGLTEIGSVEDLGVGERVQSVRFLGDTAYVVTFRQTDPLYAIDLSEPTDPRALGELKITGFSQYLHPVGEGLLLGIGREATEGGSDLGFKASLFDVSDPTAPTEIDEVVIPNADSLVSSDPLAFAWDPVAHHTVIPLERYDISTDGGFLDCPPGAVCEAPAIDCPPEADCVAAEPAGPTQVALVLGVDGNELTEVAELTHDTGGADPWQSQILRSLVVDRDLWTLSRAGLGLSDADAPTGVDLLGF